MYILLFASHARSPAEFANSSLIPPIRAKFADGLLSGAYSQPPREEDKMDEEEKSGRDIHSVRRTPSVSPLCGWLMAHNAVLSSIRWASGRACSRASWERATRNSPP